MSAFGAGSITSIVNLVLCLLLLWHSARNARAVSLVWFMNAYFAWFFLLMSNNGPYSRSRGFTAELITVNQATIDYLAVYALACNVLFFIGYSILFSLSGGNRYPARWEADGSARWVRFAAHIYLAFLIVGSLLYWLKMRNLGYRGYVEFQFQGSNWPVVFLWASAPYACLMAMQKRFVLAVAATLPFMFFALHLNVRSFALLSLIPISIVFYFQKVRVAKKFGADSIKLFIKGLPIILILIATSIVITYNKQSRLHGVPDEGQLTGLPDSGLVYGAGLVFSATLKSDIHLGFNSLQKYFVTLATPFVKLGTKLMGIPAPLLEDTPVFMARVIDGVPKNYSVYHHYPVLWYSDAIVSFGQWGVILGLLWGAVAALWERFLRVSWTLCALLLPFYCWHMYMLIRGATAVAAVPISYAMYVSLLVFLLVRFFARPTPIAGKSSPVTRQHGSSILQERPNGTNISP